MVNLVLPPKLLSRVKTAYRINSTYENSSVEVEINKWVQEKKTIKKLLCSCNIAYKKLCIPIFKPKLFLIIEWGNSSFKATRKVLLSPQIFQA